MHEGFVILRLRLLLLIISKKMNFLTLLGLVAAFFTTASSLPQLIKSLKTKKTKDLSMPMLVMICLGVLLWLIYGILIRNLPIIVANSTSLVFFSTILFLKIKYN